MGQYSTFFVITVVSSLGLFQDLCAVKKGCETYAGAQRQAALAKQAKKVIPLENPQYYLCVAAMFRDEARFLKEWIEYHLMLGVEHFYLTNHLSKDNYMEVLQPYIDKGLVTLEQERREKAQHVTGEAIDYRGLQHEAYMHAVRASRNKTEWLLICDTDEFAFPHQAKDIPSVLRQYDDYPAVCFNWKLFGTSHIARLKEGALLIEKMILSAKGSNQAYKSFVKPRYVTSCHNEHCMNLEEGFLMVGPDKQPVPIGCALPKRPGLVQQKILNFYHYTMRDEEFFREVKIPRLANINWHQHLVTHRNLFNDVKDTSMHRFVPALKKRMGFAEERASPPVSNEDS